MSSNITLWKHGDHTPFLRSAQIWFQKFWCGDTGFQCEPGRGWTPENNEWSSITLIQLRLDLRIGRCLITGNVLNSGWTKISLRNTFRTETPWDEDAVWWDSAGLIHHGFIKPSGVINVDAYCQQIAKWRVQIVGIVNWKARILCLDNDRPHVFSRSWTTLTMKHWLSQRTH